MSDDWHKTAFGWHHDTKSNLGDSFLRERRIDGLFLCFGFVRDPIDPIDPFEITRLRVVRGSDDDQRKSVGRIHIKSDLVEEVVVGFQLFRMAGCSRHLQSINVSVRGLEEHINDGI